VAAPDKKIRRFTPAQRVFHLVLVVLFMLLSVTGVGWMYLETQWGQSLAWLFGGYVNLLLVHRLAGLAMLAMFVVQALFMLAAIRPRALWASLTGPDSLVWNLRDFAEVVRHLGWVLGLCKVPVFERWSWWEKFDYWAVWWGLIIVGVTGLMLYDPLLSSEYLPGWMFNVALWVHRIEAVLAMGHIFTVHFFLENFRPSVFPFSPAIFDGGMTLAEARHEHPAWVARLEREGQLEDATIASPPWPVRIGYFLFGYAMIVLGAALTVFAILNAALLTFWGS
jgi:cytochrome b subunit of formate dehydrogenase